MPTINERFVKLTSRIPFPKDNVLPASRQAAAAFIYFDHSEEKMEQETGVSAFNR